MNAFRKKFSKFIKSLHHHKNNMEYILHLTLKQSIKKM